MTPVDLVTPKATVTLVTLVAPGIPMTPVLSVSPLSPTVPHCPSLSPLSLTPQRCPHFADAPDPIFGPTAPGRDPPPSPLTERKKQRRKKLSTPSKTESAAGQAEEEENFEFLIVSSSGQTWHFEAGSFEERDAWVTAIEGQILARLQGCDSGRSKASVDSHSEAVAIQEIRSARGNSVCVDCGAP
ncbi:hypothetical protein ASZ78_016648, partial [Callipepla squamata]